jgi:hypothetical protein
LVVRAEEEENKPSLSFKANDRAALGFTEQDSAGQTNIFAVEVSLVELCLVVSTLLSTSVCSINALPVLSPTLAEDVRRGLLR